MSAVHVAVEVVCLAIVLGIALLGVCAAIQSGANEPPTPHVPANVDLEQCRATTIAIDEATRPARSVEHTRGRA